MSPVNFASRISRIKVELAALALVARAGIAAAVLLAAPGAHANGWCGAAWACEQPVPRLSNTAYYDKWTAIAVSDSTLVSGSSWAANTKERAEALALAECSKFASDCKLRMSGVNTCIALATSPAGRSWGADLDRNGARAKAKALKACQNVSGQDCVIQSDPCAHD